MEDLGAPASVMGGIIYGFRTLDPETLSTIELGYIGQTRQRLRAREAQHRDEQPWSDIIVGSAYVIAQGEWSAIEMDEAERWAIRLLKPRYNVDENRANERRIPVRVAVRQRQARDRSRGIPVWMPPAAAFPRPVGPASVSVLPQAGGTRQMHGGHERVLAAIAAGHRSPKGIQDATGYKERQVHNLLKELRDEFGQIVGGQDVGSHGRYTLAPKVAS